MSIDKDKIIKIITTFDDPEPFSGVIYYEKDSMTQFFEAFGLANRPYLIPNRLNTRFQIASGSKIFTAVAISQLVEAGKLAFDTRLSDCLDLDFPNFSDKITVHHLLTHSSGITSYFEEDIDPDYEKLWLEKPVYAMRQPADFVPMFQNKPMKFEPGTKFDYNDAGFIILALIVEAISGQSFTIFVEQNIFGVAGMIDSGYFQSDQLPERTAHSYIKNEDNSWRSNIFSVPIKGGGDGGAYTTADDIARFWKALSGFSLLNQATTELMLKDYIKTDYKDPIDRYGYGVWRNSISPEIYTVMGYDPGVSFRSSYNQEIETILTLLGNSSEAMWPLYKKLEEHLIL